MIVFIITWMFTVIAGFILVPKFIRFFKNAGIVGKDKAKDGEPEVAEMGGLPVLVTFVLGSLFYVAIQTFYIKTAVLSTFLAAILTVTLTTLVGMLDDLTSVFSRQLKKKVGFRQTEKFLLPAFAAIPLMALSAGNSSMNIPLSGVVDLGILYPLAVIPIAVIGASNATNMLAGMNGLEAGLGVILLTSLGLYSFVQTNWVATSIAFLFVAALLAFLWYNTYPARIFPGDSLTYTIGAMAAVTAILGNIEMFALVCFIPWFIEFLLKARSLFRAESFGKRISGGYLVPPYEKNYSLTHVVMRFGRMTEKRVVTILWGFEALCCLLAFLLYLQL